MVFDTLSLSSCKWLMGFWLLLNLGHPKYFSFSSLIIQIFVQPIALNWWSLLFLFGCLCIIILINQIHIFPGSIRLFFLVVFRLGLYSARFSLCTLSYPHCMYFHTFVFWLGDLPDFYMKFLEYKAHTFVNCKDEVNRMALVLGCISLLFTFGPS